MVLPSKVCHLMSCGSAVAVFRPPVSLVVQAFDLACQHIHRVHIRGRSCRGQHESQIAIVLVKTQAADQSRGNAPPPVCICAWPYSSGKAC